MTVAPPMAQAQQNELHRNLTHRHINLIALGGAIGTGLFVATGAGRAAHGSTRYAGVSAFEAFWPIHTALQELEERINANPNALFAGNPLPYGISVGKISAGDWASSVPDLLIAEGRLGVPIDSDPAEARRQFEEAVAEACRRDPWLKGGPGDVRLAHAPREHVSLTEMFEVTRALAVLAVDRLGGHA